MTTTSAFATTASNGSGSLWTNVSHAAGQPDGQSATIAIGNDQTKYLNVAGLGVGLPGNATVTGYGFNLWCAWSGSLDSGLILGYSTSFNGSVDAQGGTDVESSSLYEHMDSFGAQAFMTPVNCGTVTGVISFSSLSAGTHTVSVDAVQLVVAYTVPVPTGGFRSRARGFGRQR